MEDHSLHQKNFVWQLGKAIVSKIAPGDIGIYDEMAAYYIENDYQEDTSPTQHLSTETTLYVLTALNLIWPVVLKHLGPIAQKIINPGNETKIVQEIQMQASHFSLSVKTDIITTAKEGLAAREVLQDYIDPTTQWIQRFLFEAQALPDVGEYSVPTTNKTVLILTPLPIELTAVLHHLTALQEPEVKDQIAYEKGTFQGKHHQYQVIVAEPGMKNTEMALATERAIKRHAPQIVLLIGIAGGVKDVAIGDVVVAKKAYGYEAGKEGEGQFWARPSVEAFSGELLARAQLLSRRDDWKRRAPDGAEGAKVFMGPIAAGEKVVTSSGSETYKRLKEHYNDTLALEMEAIGFATAIQPHRELHGLAIRGISDLLDHKGDDFQVRAAERAAAFAFELLYQLDGRDFLKEPAPNQPPGNRNTIKVENARNTIIGSNINIGGNLTLGDTTTINTIGGGHLHADLSLIEKLVQRGHLEKAIEQLQSVTKNKAPIYRQDALTLSERMEELAKKIRRGVISNSEQTLERNQIVAALLELVEKLNKG